MSHGPPDVLIMGATARAAARSAARAGLSVACADYFADLDLLELGPAARIDPGQAESQFTAFALTHPRLPWLYTGGFENRRALVDLISRDRPLWGASGGVLERVRDPFQVARVFERAGIAHPRVRPSPEGLPRDGSWLMKPLASGGGRDVAPLVDEQDSPSEGFSYQERIAGRLISALYLGAGDRAVLVAASRQWEGAPGAPFGYRGSLGPIAIGPRLAVRLTSIGQVLARSFAIPGWFGVDFMLAQGVPWPLEINPRYTASIEVHELATGVALLPHHRRACEAGTLPEPCVFPITERKIVVAKRIVYASRRLVAPVIDRAEYQPLGSNRPATIADVPAAGTVFQSGEPVLTVLARARTARECKARAIDLERLWTERLETDAPRPSG